MTEESKKQENDVSVKETARRKAVLEKFVEEKKRDKDVLGVILVGSLAYAPNHSVKPDSDIDLIVVYDDKKLKKASANYYPQKTVDVINAETNLDGYMAKNEIDGVPVSLHVISESTLKKIAAAKPAELRYYRQKPKDFTYTVTDYRGNDYKFKPKTSPMADGGEIRIDNVAPPVTPDGSLVIGNDVDKFLSAGTVILDNSHGRIKKNINNMWKNAVKNYVDANLPDDKKAYPALSEDSKELVALFCRSDRFSEPVYEYLNGRVAARAHKELRKKLVHYRLAHGIDLLAGKLAKFKKGCEK